MHFLLSNKPVCAQRVGVITGSGEGKGKGWSIQESQGSGAELGELGERGGAPDLSW